MDVGGRTNEMSWRCSLAATNETTRWIASNDCGSVHFIFTFILSAVWSRSELLAAHAAAPCPSCSKNHLQNCKTWDSSWIQKQTMNQIGFEVTLIYGNQTLQYLGSFGLAKAKDPFSGGVSKNRDEEWCFFLSWKTPRWNSRENPWRSDTFSRCQIQRSATTLSPGACGNSTEVWSNWGPWQSIKLRVSCSLQFSTKALIRIHNKQQPRKKKTTTHCKLLQCDASCFCRNILNVLLFWLP